jgi:DNA-binding response OmpR family regulator
MNSQSLIVYKLSSLYHILEEIYLDLNFKIIFVDNEESLKDRIKRLKNYLIISDKNYLDLSNLFVLDNIPTSIFKLLEKLNIQFLKLQFNNQTEIKIDKYFINLNSREISINDVAVKLTEKEISIIFYLAKSSKPVRINELQEKVWNYNFDTETHTVETHIYRLRKKILRAFSDSEFITSNKNGYKIKSNIV